MGDSAAADASDSASESSSIDLPFVPSSGASSNDAESDGACTSCDGSDNKNAIQADGGADSGDDDDAAGQGDGSGDQDDEHKPHCTLCFTEIDVATAELHTAEEVLECDGGCGIKLPPGELRFNCQQCGDFDLCMKCAGLSRHEARARRRAVVVAAQGIEALSLPSTPASTRQAAATPSPARPSPARGAAPQVDKTAAAAAKLVADAAAALRHRQQRDLRQQQQQSSMAGFHAWQAQRAASRAAATAAARQRPSPAPSEADEPMDEKAAPPNPPGAATTPATDYALAPPPAFPRPGATASEIRDQVAQMLAAGDESRRLAIDFAREVFRQVPSAELAAAARSFGDAVIQNGEEEPTGAPSVAQPAEFRVHTYQSAALSPGDVTYQEPCDCCDDVVGEGASAQCAALQLLATMAEDMLERDAIVEREMDGDPDGDYGWSHRQARYFLYRKFVAAKYGYLGYGNRVRIPDCVVRAIRARYRAPGCDCPVARLASCRMHGYVGYRAHR